MHISELRRARHALHSKIESVHVFFPIFPTTQMGGQPKRPRAQLHGSSGGRAQQQQHGRRGEARARPFLNNRPHVVPPGDESRQKPSLLHFTPSLHIDAFSRIRALVSTTRPMTPPNHTCTTVRCIGGADGAEGLWAVQTRFILWQGVPGEGMADTPSAVFGAVGSRLLWSCRTQRARESSDAKSGCRAREDG